MTRDTDPDFVYVVYIHTTPEKLWAALTDNTSYRAFWADSMHESSFEKGSPIRYVRRNGKVDVEGEILDVEPGRRLVYTFHVTGPGPQHDEGPSTVEYLIEQSGPETKLTVTHSGFSKKNSALRVGISNGWPTILSSLKTVMEGGKPLVFPQWAQKT